MKQTPTYYRLIRETETQIWTSPNGLEIPNIECITVQRTKISDISYEHDRYEIVFEDGRKITAVFSRDSTVGKLPTIIYDKIKI